MSETLATATKTQRLDHICSIAMLSFSLSHMRLNYNEMLLSNGNVIFQIMFCQVTVLKNPEVKPDDLDALS